MQGEREQFEIFKFIIDSDNHCGRIAEFATTGLGGK